MEASGDFGVIGLDPHEELIYRHVLAAGSSSPEEVAAACGVSPDGARVSLESLRGRGLISRSAVADRYFAVDPRVAVRALSEHTAMQLERLRAGIPALAATYEETQREAGQNPMVRVVEGGDAVGGWYNRLEHQATEEFLAFDRPPYVLAPVNPMESVVIARGVSWRAVYSAASLEREGAWEEMRRSARSGEQARIAAELPVKLAIADRRIAIVSSSLDPDRPAAVVTEAPPLVEMLCAVFESYWNLAAEVPLAATDEGSGPLFDEDPTHVTSAPSPDDLAMLALFAAGVKDEVIARELGISARTLRRRSQVLLRSLDAANRFQAGAQAVRLGWI
jgi:DNA-binding NarL/FixJ family response regulator